MQWTFIEFKIIIASAGCVKYIAVNTGFNLHSMLIMNFNTNNFL